MAAKHNPRLLPVAALLLGASLWGLMWYPLRLLEQAGLSGLWATALMFGGASLSGVLLVRRRWPEFAAHPGVLLLIALANGWCNIAFILALLDGTVVRVLLLFYLAPIWATLLGVLWLGERPSRASLATLSLAMLGALVMLWDPAIGAPWPRGVAEWLAISSGLAFALSNVAVRQAQSASVEVKTAASWFGVALLALLGLALSGAPLPQASVAATAGAVLLGVLGLSVMTLAVLYGVTHMPVHRSSVIMLFEIVVATLSSQLLTEEAVAARDWLGGALIVLASYLLARAQLQERV